jgi:hypothetical protein
VIQNTSVDQERLQALQFVKGHSKGSQYSKEQKILDARSLGECGGRGVNYCARENINTDILTHLEIGDRRSMLLLIFNTLINMPFLI